MAFDSTAENPRLLFEADHAHLDALLGDVIAHANHGDVANARDVWTRFERALLAHMNAEEMYALPVLSEACVAEKRRLHAEHEALRSSMGKIGIAFDLHALPIEMLECIRDFLRAHMDSEESLLYAETERHASVSTARLIAQRVCSAAMRASENGSRHVVRARAKRRAITRERIR